MAHFPRDASDGASATPARASRAALVVRRVAKHRLSPFAEAVTAGTNSTSHSHRRPSSTIQLHKSSPRLPHIAFASGQPPHKPSRRSHHATTYFAHRHSPAALIGVATAVAVPASAREHAHHQFGTPQQLVDAGGAVVQEWTVTGLQRSTAALPGYAARGQLWEATATVRAVTGTVTPIIPNLHAVTAGGQRWPVIWQIANPQGLPGGTLAQGKPLAEKCISTLSTQNRWP